MPCRKKRERSKKASFNFEIDRDGQDGADLAKMIEELKQNVVSYN